MPVLTTLRRLLTGAPLDPLDPATLGETTALARETGWIFVVSTMLLAHSQSGGIMLLCLMWGAAQSPGAGSGS